MELSSQEQEPVLSSGFAGRDQAIGQAQIFAEIPCGGVVIEKAIGTGFDAVAILMNGSNGAAQALPSLKDLDIGLGQLLLESISHGKPGDPSANDHYLHDYCSGLSLDFRGGECFSQSG